MNTLNLTTITISSFEESFECECSSSFSSCFSCCEQIQEVNGIGSLNKFIS
jgi:hypothetical protein